MRDDCHLSNLISLGGEIMTKKISFFLSLLIIASVLLVSCKAAATEEAPAEEPAAEEPAAEATGEAAENNQ